MDIKQAITERHSVRQYKDLPVSVEAKERLEALVKECNEASGLNIQLICNDPDCFNTFMAHYGKFSKANNYFAMVAKKDLPNRDELIGYYGQKLVLEAQMLGLNTCWVAGTYGKGKCKANIAAGEKIICVISLGYGENSGSVHKSKPVEKLCDVPESERPDWFKEGLEAALLAPTALNQQKFRITLKDGEPVITTKGGPMTKIDLGIVKYNFEIASGHSCL